MPRLRFARMLWGPKSLRGFCGLAALTVACSGWSVATAQQQSSGSRPTLSKTPPAKNSEQPTGGQDSESGGQRIRPVGQPMRVKNVPPELMQLLKDWEVASAKIKKLEGEHRRWEYDYVFNVVKLNSGVFYYESPDKGRIDLKPDTRQAGSVEDKRHWETGQLVQFKRQPGPAERWYCDGQLITQVNDQDRTATRMVIPKQNQGVNIIDGPLPFLFGMPAAKAIQRYDLELKKLDKANGKAILKAIPLWPADAANYQLAEIILDTNKYLPEAVRLIDPAGTKETVFTFGKLEKNKGNFVQQWFNGDPFKFDDKRYKIVIKAPIEERAEQSHDKADQRVAPASGTRIAPKPTNSSSSDTGQSLLPSNTAKSRLSTLPPGQVPSVIGLEWKQAREILETLGYKVSLKKGSIANRSEEKHRVERQQPNAKEKLAEGETVTLWLFIADE